MEAFTLKIVFNQIQFYIEYNYQYKCNQNLDVDSNYKLGMAWIFKKVFMLTASG